MAVIGTMIFLGAMTLSVAAIWLSIAPHWRRIARLAAGQVEQPFQPLGELAQAERRIAIKRWASSPAPAGLARLRVAA